MYLLFDIGGTKMRVSVAPDLFNFHEPAILDTPQEFDDAMALLEEKALELSRGTPLRGVCGGVAGPLDATGNFLANAPHLPKWVGKPLKRTLEAAFNAPVHIFNDCSLVGLGEATSGAGKDAEIMAYLSVSTGVGGVRIVKQTIDAAHFGFEPGHQIIHENGTICPGCGGRGHLEAYVSGSAIERRFGKHPKEITDPAVWEELSRYLAVGVYNTILMWSPEVVVIGGSMMKEIGIPLARVEHHLSQLLTILPKPPALKLATLGDIGGLHGALHFLRSQKSSFS
jgi:predicted NBD/HSP70 family sugar kinase